MVAVFTWAWGIYILEVERNNVVDGGQRLLDKRLLQYYLLSIDATNVTVLPPRKRTRQFIINFKCTRCCTCRYSIFFKSALDVLEHGVDSRIDATLELAYDRFPQSFPDELVLRRIELFLRSSFRLDALNKHFL